tara:strand:- start:3175 stop:3876 length:702 start_codon:yes stop_codon:yes gene_type:complete
MKDTLIFTATYNEIKNIKKLLKQINLYSNRSDILIIDDNSPDGTGKIIEKFRKNNKNIKFKLRKYKQGLDSAHKYAYEYAKKNKYKKLITMDADLSHDPKLIKKIIKLLDNNSFVIGSRYIKGGANKIGLFRFLLSYFGNKFIKFILNINLSEFTTSYRGFNIPKLKGFHLNKINSKGYSFFMETVYQIYKKKFKIKEIPIIFISRIHGKSKIPKIETLRTLTNVFRLKFLQN